MARASELLDVEPSRIVETLRKILVPDGYSDWDIVDALFDLPEPTRTIIAVRFGEPMTLADIGDALGVSPERVRLYEKQAIDSIATHVGTEWPRKDSGKA